MTRRTKLTLASLGALGALAILFVGWQGVRAFNAWNSIERVPFDLAVARDELPSTTALAEGEQVTPAPELVPVGYETVLVIGSDFRDSRDEQLDASDYADAVLLYLLPDDGGAPSIVSFPRDLAVIDPCSGAVTKLARTLNGCGDVPGSQLVALAVEDFGGIPIDHFAALRFEALVEMVDAVGGVELCSEYALREGSLDLLPAGCSTVDGQTALAWIRSRQTQEFVDGEWRFVESTGDSARIGRQQELLFALLTSLKEVRSPTELAGLAEQLGDTIVLSDTLGLGDAVALAWDLRSVSGSSIRTIMLPTEPMTLPDGSFALRATSSVRELIED